MKIFRCQSCEQVVFFENTQCMHCGTVLGFLPDHLLLSGLAPADAGHWRPLTYAVNSLNRSMGQPDLYPFVLSPPVLSRLDFVHRTVRQTAATS